MFFVLRRSFIMELELADIVEEGGRESGFIKIFDVVCEHVNLTANEELKLLQTSGA